MNKGMAMVAVDELQKAYKSCRDIAMETDNIRTMVQQCINGDCSETELRANLDILKVKINKTKRIHERMAKVFQIIERALG
jgi:hypothetical protein